MKRWQAILLILCMFMVGWLDAVPMKINLVAADCAADARC